ncbi:unnamed protein product [Polarella glacialis]|uniref:Uncharacterized protein n=1 Tax=Polarella glacialis TaxID=89957 RepID=A0A813G138_POLGL|nr:unnamed protein product [Polarella glacialis]
MDSSVRWSADFGAATSAKAGGYSRRCQPGDPKTTDRRRLLADRNEYIAYLETHVERANGAALEAESAAAELRQLRIRMDGLEESSRSIARTVDSVQAQSSHASEHGLASRQEVQEQLQLLEGRTHRLEQRVSEGQTTAEAEIARLRNEVSLAVQELGQRLDERVQALKDRLDDRVQALQSIHDDGTSLIIREAQSTCVRLADDALGASEASQRKVDELTRQVETSKRRLDDFVSQTEAGLEALSADVIGVRAQLAGLTAATSAASADSAEAAVPTTTHTAGVRSSSIGPDSFTDGVADQVERRLAGRLGQQVLQLSNVLRRVVQSQASLSQQLSARQPVTTSTSASNLLAEADYAELSSGSYYTSPQAGNGVTNDVRRTAVDELYRELRQLEASTGACRTRRA